MPARARSSSRRRALGGFALAGAVALAVVLVLALAAAQRAGTEEAIREARGRTELLSHAVETNLSAGLISGDPAALADLDRVVRDRVLGPSVARVKIWGADGTILYSDQPELIGSRYPLGAEEQEILREGGVEAEISDLSKQENRFERSYQKMLEVYLPIRSPEGTPLLFETYSPYTAVTESAQRIRGQFLPSIVGGLLLFGLLLVPLAWRLTTQIQKDQQEKARLMQTAIEASEEERRRLAGDLHDGVVQDLSGIALSLAALGPRLPPESPESQAVSAAAAHTRGAVQSLRSLLVEIYPASLKEAGLDSALRGLTASLAARGIDTTVHIEADLSLSDDNEALVFRVAQEALRNVVRHAGASAVSVTLSSAAASARPASDAPTPSGDDVAGWVVLLVADDGVGIQPRPGGDDAGPHLGLRLLREAADRAGGSLSIGPGEQGGTTLRLEVPTS